MLEIHHLFPKVMNFGELIDCRLVVPFCFVLLPGGLAFHFRFRSTPQSREIKFMNTNKHNGREMAFGSTESFQLPIQSNLNIARFSVEKIVDTVLANVSKFLV